MRDKRPNAIRAVRCLYTRLGRSDRSTLLAQFGA